MNPVEQFANERKASIAAIRDSSHLAELSDEWVRAVSDYKYIFNFDWLGRPIIQCGVDMVAVQEAIWATQPTLIIETGIAHGGSAVFHASLLALLDLCDAAARGVEVSPTNPQRRVVAVDIDIRAHNRQAIEAHPLASYITMIEGSSISPDVISRVYDIASRYESVMVVLDSHHTEAHVFAELEAYAPLVALNNYIIVFDTAIEMMPNGYYVGKPWAKGNNPLTAIRKFLPLHPDFVIDESLASKLLIGNAPQGFLRRAQAMEQ